VIQAARQTSVLGRTYSTVVVASHSYGSAVAALEAVRYHDISGFIMTGLTNVPSLVAYSDFVANSEPAMEDPRLRRQVGNDPLYITSKPGSRAHLFFSSKDTGSRVLQYDEQNKNVDTLTEFVTPFTFVAETKLITAPVLLADGQDDYFMCAQGGGLAVANCANSTTLRESESLFFSPAADLHAFVLPGAGHSINLELNARQWFTAAAAWLGNTFPGH
jgi:pimeloyl-ACP methyl ester carboxylesterase